MCEADPGPRCSYDMSKKLKSREQAYTKAVERFGSDSPEAELAYAKANVALREYETTPEGIKTLKNNLERYPNSSAAKQLLTRAVLTRQMQVNALNEVKIERPDKIASIYSAGLGFFDKEETTSIIQSVRETYEQKVLISAMKHDVSIEDAETKASKEEYNEYLKQLSLLSNTQESKKTLEELKKMSPPSTTLLRAYKNVLPAFKTSREQLKVQLEDAATLQNTSLATVQAYFEAYRDQYKKEFSNLPAKDQPNPPEAWVKGEFTHAGFSKNPTTKLAPHDNASLYALYRLQTDDQAIPDYQKQAKQFLAVQVDDNSLNTTCYTGEGKAVKTFSLPRNASGLAQLNQEMEGKILLTSNAGKQKTSQTLDPHRFITKYYDYPQYDSSFLSKQLESNNIVDIFFQTRKKTKQLWKAKTSRSSVVVVEPLNKTRWTA